MKDSADIRKVNLYKIRKILWNGEWKTKQQIAIETGLSVASCNTLLNELSNIGEVISEKIRLHEVGPGALQYRINENYEYILCIWFDRLNQHDVLTKKLLATTGKIIFEEQKEYDSLNPLELQKEIESIYKRYSNITSIMIGTPSIAENGVIRHCDITSLEGFPIVSALINKLNVSVYLENDMHFKVFGYSKKNNIENDVVTIANFPIGILPGTASVHDGIVIKGHNQFAGMVGFLPYDCNQKELLDKLKPNQCHKVVSKAIASIISILNPNTIVLTGELLDEKCIDWIYENCKQWIPESYMPQLIYQKQMDSYYLEGMYQKAIELKGVF